MLVPWRVSKGTCFSEKPTCDGNCWHWCATTALVKPRCRVASDPRTNAAGVGFWGEGSLEDSATKRTKRPIAWKPIPPPKNRSWNGPWLLDFFWFHFFKKWLKRTKASDPFGRIYLGTETNEHIAEIYTVIQLTGGCIQATQHPKSSSSQVSNLWETPKVFLKILPKLTLEIRLTLETTASYLVISHFHPGPGFLIVGPMFLRDSPSQWHCLWFGGWWFGIP